MLPCKPATLPGPVSPDIRAAAELPAYFPLPHITSVIRGTFPSTSLACWHREHAISARSMGLLEETMSSAITAKSRESSSPRRSQANSMYSHLFLETFPKREALHPAWNNTRGFGSPSATCTWWPKEASAQTALHELDNKASPMWYRAQIVFWGEALDEGTHSLQQYLPHISQLNSPLLQYVCPNLLQVLLVAKSHHCTTAKKPYHSGKQSQSWTWSKTCAAGKSTNQKEGAKPCSFSAAWLSSQHVKLNKDRWQRDAFLQEEAATAWANASVFLNTDMGSAGCQVQSLPLSVSSQGQHPGLAADGGWGSCWAHRPSSWPDGPPISHFSSPLWRWSCSQGQCMVNIGSRQQDSASVQKWHSPHPTSKSQCARTEGTTSKKRG